uniref:G-protein coupled receptors family 1 profile domain-containing protein n=1 Tax=Ditylenchus dipsaci TaxID=166011 RepID=A0A915ETQ9_9BILA
MNYNNVSNTNCYGPRFTRCLSLFLFTCLILLALGGNVLVCAAVFFDRKLRRQPENLFLVSLAVSDLFVSVLVMIFAAANDLLGYWPFGEAYCQFWICLDIACSTASILNLCSIAFDRYLHISRPMKYARYSNKVVICIAIAVIWLVSLFLGSAQIIFGVAGTELLETAATTTVRLVTEQYLEPSNLSSRPTCQLMLMPLYAIVSSILSFFLPATIMVALYTKLYLYARMHVRSIRAQLKQATSMLILQLASDHNRIRQVVVRPCFLASHTALHYGGDLIKCNSDSMQHTFTCSNNNNNICNTHQQTRSSNSSNSSAPPTCDNIAGSTLKQDTNCNVKFLPNSQETKKSTGRSVSDQKARLTLVAVFCDKYLEVTISDFFPPRVFQVVTWLGYANSTANPIIYGIFNRDFRRAFSRIVFKVFYCFKDNHKRAHFYANDI